LAGRASSWALFSLIVSLISLRSFSIAPPP
jgi:hypothetical protein